MCALNSARTLAQWREAEEADCVRLKLIPEEENYFDVYGHPETQKEKDMIIASIERQGLWLVVAEVNTGDEQTGSKWEFADSIGMCCYDNPLSPFENCYVIDLMRAALDQIPVCGQH